MLQGDCTDGEAGDVFEKRLLGGRIELLFVSNRSFIDGEFSAVFHPANGPLANFPCLFKPSYFADFLREPRMPIFNKDFTRFPPDSTCLFPAIMSGSALECDFSAKFPRFPAQQADQTTQTRPAPVSAQVSLILGYRVVAGIRTAATVFLAECRRCSLRRASRCRDRELVTPRRCPSWDYLIAGSIPTLSDGYGAWSPLPSISNTLVPLLVVPS
jgi:hypothetical protein